MTKQDNSEKTGKPNPGYRIRLDDDPFYDKIARLNNELMNIQRRLTKSRFDLKRQNTKLEEQHSELASLNKLKNEMIGMAAHDLRNPLYIIMALSELLLEQDPDSGSLNEFQEESVQEIHRSSKFMLNLINDMLDLSLIESGTISMDIEDVDLPALLQRSVKLHQMLAGQKKLSIIFENKLTSTEASTGIGSNHEKLLIPADSGKLEQVINNLLGNAIKFSPAHSTISLLLEKGDSAGFVADRKPYQAGDLLIHIVDQGPGITPENQIKLFKPFSRIDTGTSGKEKSTGLGLAISRKIVEAHGWSIHIDSEVGKGSVFTVHIPTKQLTKSNDDT